MYVRFITIPGVGTICTYPNTMILEIEIANESDTPKNALIENDIRYYDTLETLEKIIDLEKIQLVSQVFSLDKDIQNVVIGHICKKTIKIELSLDMTYLEQIVSTILSNDLKVMYRIKFALRNFEEIKKEAIKLAMEDSISKTKYIEENSKMQAGEIRTFEHKVSDLEILTDIVLENVSLEVLRTFNLPIIKVIENVVIVNNIY